MHSHLMVMTFEREEEAPRVYDALQRMRGKLHLGLENAAAVTKDGHGRLAIYQRRELSPDGESSDHDLIGSAVALLFGAVPDDSLQGLTKQGFDDRFRQQVARDLGNNSSAVLVLVAPDSQADRGPLLGILNLFQGRVYETTLPMEVETALAKGWGA